MRQLCRSTTIRLKRAAFHADAVRAFLLTSKVAKNAA
jgi:hypothetical protein